MTYNYENSGNDVAISSVGNVPYHDISLHISKLIVDTLLWA